MKAAILALFAAITAHAATTGPIRVLYLDPEGKEQTAVGKLHEAMRDLGRDAIWFDYFSKRADVPQDAAVIYDAMINTGTVEVNEFVAAFKEA
ncbi:MAG TPA: hypothetical protein DDZ88_04950, partial [Verrucomicrobiales bacterium]|nr:hypothetical protein [Verrucomicrobiales bacterium]